MNTIERAIATELAKRALKALQRWRRSRRARKAAKAAGAAVVILVALLCGCSAVQRLADKGITDQVLPPSETQPELLVTNEPQREPISITSWGKEPAPNATLDPAAVLCVSSDGKHWSWSQPPDWKQYRISSSRRYYAACYIAVKDGDEWKAGKFDHLPTDLNERDRKNVHSGYARLRVPETGETVYWFAVSNDKSKRSNLVKGAW